MSDELRRFFVDASVLKARNVSLSGDLAHRLAKVLRYKRGDSVILAGSGENDYVVQLTAVSANAVAGLITGEQPAPHEASVEVVLYQSMIRANRFDFVLEKGTEAGVARFVPVMATRTQLQMDETGPARADRWRRLITEAAEQCGRGRLPAVEPSQSFEDAVRTAPGLKLVPWEGEREQRLGDYLRSLKEKPRAVSVFIGPEGGYEPSEIELAKASGAVLVTLGRRVMRAETAAIIAAGIILHELDR